MTTNPNDQKDVVLKIDGKDDGGVGPVSKIWRESSYDFVGDAESRARRQGDRDNGSDRFEFNSENTSSKAADGGRKDDPPSKLISQFLHKQKASGEFCLDMDLEMAELQNDGVVIHRNLAPVTESPTTNTNRVSFDPNPPGSSESVRRRRQLEKDSSPNRGSNGGADGEILKCSPRDERSLSHNSSFNYKRKSTLLKERTKSRLMDPPPEKSGRMPVGGRSGQLKSGQLQSGVIGKGNAAEEEEDDPFWEEDLPEEFKKDKLDVWTLLEWVSLILIIAALACSLAIPYLRDKHLWKLMLWKWEVMILVLICGRLVSSWVIRIAVFFIERNFVLRKRVLYFVYGIRKPVQNCLWVGFVLIAWHFLFDKKVQRETRSSTLQYVTKILICLVVGTLLWLVKTLIVKVLASSFHVSTYFDRIQESLFNQYVIETLSGPPMIEIKRNKEEEESLAAEVQTLQNAGVSLPPALKAVTCPSPQINRVIGGSDRLQKSPRIGTPKLSHVLSSKSNEGNDGITLDQLHRLNPKNVSAWNMKRLMNIIRHGALSTLDEKIQNSNIAEDESDTKIKSEYEAKVAARKIFQNVTRPGSRYIFLEDVMRFMPEEEAEKTMGLFEGAPETKKISKKCLKNWVVNAFRERRALALTLNDTKTAVNKLHGMVNVLVGILIVIVWLLILGVATSKFLLFLSSQLVVVAFIFGNTCKTVFEAVIFLFVIHPFDVGDRCEIDGVQMIVEEMNILTTVFLRFDNQKIIIGNSVLATKAISNYYRSPDMGEAVEFMIHIATPAEKIALIKLRITSYIENKSEHWYPSPMIIFRDFEDLTRVRIAIWFTHRMNHQDMGERFVRRSLLLEEMAKIFKDLDIQYRLLPLEINVCAFPNMTSDRLPANWTSGV